MRQAPVCRSRRSPCGLFSSSSSPVVLSSSSPSFEPKKRRTNTKSGARKVTKTAFPPPTVPSPQRPPSPPPCRHLHPPPPLPLRRHRLTTACPPFLPEDCPPVGPWSSGSTTVNNGLSKTNSDARTPHADQA